MNNKLFADCRVYPKIVLHWGAEGNETNLDLKDKTIAEAYEIAIQFGYQPPVWYKPWQYITGGLFIMTVGFGEYRFNRAI